MNTWGMFRGFIPKEKLPIDGSEGDFHDVSVGTSFVLSIFGSVPVKGVTVAQMVPGGQPYCP